MNNSLYEGLVDAQDFMVNMPAESLSLLLLKCILVIILNVVLGRIYLLYGSSFSDRRNLASGFLILSLTTMLLITVVKSSLALSLGLVGALSIVRFRTPIKEPEDLLYLFLSIAIGLGFGASQITITSFMAGIIMLVIVILGKARDKNSSIDGTTITIETTSSSSIDELIKVLVIYCKRVSLNSYEHSVDNAVMIFDIEVKDTASIELIKNDIIKLEGKKVLISFVDSQYGRVF